MKSRTLVIVNPAAGGGRALRAVPDVAGFLAVNNHPADFVHSKSTEDLREQAARAAAHGYRYVVALGGDGAIHHLIEGILDTPSIAGFFPAGNGNDIARDLNIPGDPVRAAEAFLHSQPRRVDLVQVRFADGRQACYVGGGGIGLDAEAAHLANTRFKAWPGVLRYLAGALTVFSEEPAFDLRANFDGVQWAGKVLFAAVANATSYGSGVHIAPDAKLDDGWLNLVLVGEMSWMRLLEAIPIELADGDLRYDEVQRFRCRRVRLEADRPVKVHGDGEILGQSPADFEVLPGAIQIMAPLARS